MTVVTRRKHLDQSKTAYAKAAALKTSPQKLGLVVDLIKGMNINQAFMQLQFSKKRIAREVSKVLNSAVSNAENNHNLDVDRLFVSEVLVGKAFTLKRFHARARGRAGKIFKPFSKMTIFVSERG